MTLCGTHFWSLLVYSLNGTVAFFLCNCYTRFLKRFSIHSKLKLNFNTNTFESCWAIFTTIFIFSLKLSHVFGVPVTQGSCNVFSLSPSGHSNLLLSFEFVYLSLIFSSGTVPLFLCNWSTRSLWYFFGSFRVEMPFYYFLLSHRLVHSQSCVAWTLTLFPHFLNGTNPFFSCNCSSRCCF